MRTSSGLGSQSERDCLRSLLSKQLMPLILLVVFAWLIVNKASGIDFASVFAAVDAITPSQWAAAVLGAVVSFWAIGRMDAVMHRLFDTGIPSHIAQLSGIASVATAQLTGFGLLTGTLARWRVLPDVSLLKAAHITGAVSAAFMMALGLLVALMVLITGPEIPLARPVAFAWLAFCIALIVGSVWRPRGLLRIKLPPIRAQASLVGYAALDTAAAAFTLYVLIPEAHLPPPALFYCIFLLALGAGLLGTTPGGVGPFEMMFIACLPSLPDAPMLAAIMGYRLVYFALPAILAATLLIMGPPGRGDSVRHAASSSGIRPAKTQSGQPVAISALSYNAPRAEAGLMRQGDFDLLYDRRDRPLSLVAPAGQSLIMLSDPLQHEHSPGEALETLHKVARQRFLTPCLYKCGARSAVIARRAGWRVVQVAQEARLSPASFTIDGQARRQLRRQLRKAQAADVDVTEAGPRPPLDVMRDIARNWAEARGGARGFSMGLFAEQYINAQRVYLAQHEGALVAFATFHEGWRERTLDLMCHRDTAPVGTMHLLITHAIHAAAADGCDTVSLAAVPRFAHSPMVPSALSARLDRITGASGLVRFKSTFGPTWEPLYLAAPGPVGLALSGIDLIDWITRPRHDMRAN